MIYKQTITEPNGTIVTLYRQENADGTLVFYMPESDFIKDWLAEGNTAEEWQPDGGGE